MYNVLPEEKFMQYGFKCSSGVSAATLLRCRSVFLLLWYSNGLVVRTLDTSCPHAWSPGHLHAQPIQHTLTNIQTAMCILAGPLFGPGAARNAERLDCRTTFWPQCRSAGSPECPMSVMPNLALCAWVGMPKVLMPNRD